MGEVRRWTAAPAASLMREEFEKARGSYLMLQACERGEAAVGSSRRYCSGMSADGDSGVAELTNVRLTDGYPLGRQKHVENDGKNEGDAIRRHQNEDMAACTAGATAAEMRASPN